MDLALLVMRQFSELVDAPRVLRMIPDDVNLKGLSKFLEVSDDTILTPCLFYKVH